jgi:hypothetical protein
MALRVAVRYSVIEGWSRELVFPNQLWWKIRDWEKSGARYRILP